MEKLIVALIVAALSLLVWLSARQVIGLLHRRRLRRQIRITQITPGEAMPELPAAVRRPHTVRWDADNDK